MAVNYFHPQYQNALERWQVTRDCVEGQQAVKSRATDYLPAFQDNDSDRYIAYLQRAYFVNVTGRTRNGLMGAVFRKDPVCKLPGELEYMKENADGTGMNIEQFAKSATKELVELGRFGILTEYPQVDEGLTVAQVNQMGLQPFLIGYKAEQIINWRTTVINGASVVTLVVLRVVSIDDVDEFIATELNQFLVLRLEQLDEFGDQLIYTQQRYYSDGNEGPKAVPRMADGQPWGAIPFSFIGSEDNKPAIDVSPLYDIANINIAHYRNTADFEEMCFISGQPTIFLSSDISYQEFQAANPNGVVVGSRAGHFLGSGGSAQMLQPQPVGVLQNAMKDKQDQMVAIGAKLISGPVANQTAEASRINASSENSVLDTIVGNLSDAITSALEYAALFIGANPDDCSFELNKDFYDDGIDPQVLIAMIQLADRGDIAQTDVRAYLRKVEAIEPHRTDENIDDDAETFGP